MDGDTPPFYTWSISATRARAGAGDTNLFPVAGTTTGEMLPLAVQAAMAAIEKICPEARNRLIIPENHTRNTFTANLAQQRN